VRDSEAWIELASPLVPYDQDLLYPLPPSLGLGGGEGGEEIGRFMEQFGLGLIGVLVWL